MKDEIELFHRLAPTVLSNTLRLADAVATGKGIKFYWESLHEPRETLDAWREREMHEPREFAGEDCEWWCDLMGVTPGGRERYKAFLLDILDGTVKFRESDVYFQTRRMPRGVTHNKGRKAA